MSFLDTDPPQLNTWTISRTKSDTWEAAGVESTTKISSNKSLDTIVKDIEDKEKVRYEDTDGAELQYAVYPSTKSGDIQYIFEVGRSEQGYTATDLQGSGMKVSASTLNGIMSEVEKRVGDPTTVMLQWAQPIVGSAGTKQPKDTSVSKTISQNVSYLRWYVGIPRRGVLACNGELLTLTNMRGREIFSVPCTTIKKIVVPANNIAMVVYLPKGRYAFRFMSLFSWKLFIKSLKYGKYGYPLAMQEAADKDGSILRWERYFDATGQPNLQPIEKIPSFAKMLFGLLGIGVLMALISIVFGITV